MAFRKHVTDQVTRLQTAIHHNHEEVLKDMSLHRDFTLDAMKNLKVEVEDTLLVNSHQMAQDNKSHVKSEVEASSMKTKTELR